jgi:hypothetical protein
MTDRRAAESGLGASFPGPVARIVLRLLLPTSRREELVGDLIEEAETEVFPTTNHASARRWFWRQAVASASPLYFRRAANEFKRLRLMWLFIVLLLIAGPLMALDPNVFGAAPGVLTLVVLAILIPAAAGLVSGNVSVLAGSAVVSAVLLLAARLSSGIEIRWYAMAFMFFVILNLGRMLERRLSRAAASATPSGNTAGGTDAAG